MVRTATCALILGWLLSWALEASAGQRAFVAWGGSDANTASECALASPCRSFGAALAAVYSGGEIVALDSADYGALIVDKPVAVIANPGVIAVSTGGHIAAAGIEVTFRNIRFRGGYVAAAAPFPPQNPGISVPTASTLTLENCVITTYFIAMSVEAPARVRIVDSTINGNMHGLRIGRGATATIERSRLIGTGVAAVAAIAGNAGETTAISIYDSSFVGNGHGVESGSEYWHDGAVRVSVSRSLFADNSNGIAIQGSSVSMTVAGSTFTGNTSYGIYALGAASFKSLGDNVVRHNGTDTMVSPSKTALPPT